MHKYKWVLCILFAAWTLMIFTRSMQPAVVSNQESGAVLEFTQRVLHVEMTMNQVRKDAHFAEFAVLGVLAQLLFGCFFRVWWERILLAVFSGFLVALCDETIQLFALGRSGQVQDIWLDLFGVVCSVLVTAAACRYIKRRKE